MLTLLKEHHIKLPEEWGVPEESGGGWEGPLGTPLGMAQWKRASFR